MQSVAVLESSVCVAAEIRMAIEAYGFRVEHIEDRASAIARARALGFALVFLDFDTPGTDAIRLCVELSPVVPVIAVTSADAEEVRVRALDSGADDCITRPFVARELLARVRSVVRRVGIQRRIADDAQSLESSVRAMRVRAGATTVDLTLGETELLAVLVAHAPAPLTTARIAESLGAKRGTVEARIKSLRRKLGPRLASRGRLGYELVDEGDAHPDPAEPPVTSPPLLSASPPGSSRSGDR